MNKVALVSHCWLDNPLSGYRGRTNETDACRRVERFLNHYSGCWPTILIDNGSDSGSCRLFEGWFGVPVINLKPNYPRKEMLDYPNVWRAYWTVKEILKEYNKIYYIATDAYVLSQRLMDYLESLDTGWTALWSKKYDFAEACIQVITKCPEFDDFFSGGCDPFKYNGLVEENTLPFTHIEKGFVGDRYSEYCAEDILNFGPIKPFKADYYTQVPDSLDFDDSLFPVVRRVNDKIVVVK